MPKLTPKQYLRKKAQLENRAAAIDEELGALVLEYWPKPDELRPATPKDIVVGNLLYCPFPPRLVDPGGTPGYWQMVGRVIRPDSDFKAYESEYGDRYGLAGAFVLKKMI